jgi:hypothetical protein
MVPWVMQPQAFEPGGAMPDTGVREGPGPRTGCGRERVAAR